MRFDVNGNAIEIANPIESAIELRIGGMQFYSVYPDKETIGTHLGLGFRKMQVIRKSAEFAVVTCEAMEEFGIQVSKETCKSMGILHPQIVDVCRVFDKSVYTINDCTEQDFHRSYFDLVSVVAKHETDLKSSVLHYGHLLRIMRDTELCRHIRHGAPIHVNTWRTDCLIERIESGEVY